MNGLLCLFVVAAVAAPHLALSHSKLRWGWWIVSALACALGCLAKGRVALLLIVVPVLLYQLLDSRQRENRRQNTGWSISLWQSARCCRGSYGSRWRSRSFLSYFFWKQNLLRYIAPFDHCPNQCGFTCRKLLLGMLPWSLLLIPLPRFLGKREGVEAERRPAALGLFLLASVWCLLFFSFAGSKRAGYILPAMPFLALALGSYLDTVLACLCGARICFGRLSPFFARV